MWICALQGPTSFTSLPGKKSFNQMVLPPAFSWTHYAKVASFCWIAACLGNRLRKKGIFLSFPVISSASERLHFWALILILHAPRHFLASLKSNRSVFAAWACRTSLYLTQSPENDRLFFNIFLRQSYVHDRQGRGRVGKTSFMAVRNYVHLGFATKSKIKRRMQQPIGETLRLAK